MGACQAGTYTPLLKMRPLTGRANNDWLPGPSLPMLAP